MISNIITTRTGEERLLGYDVTVEPANSEVIEPTGNLLGGRPSVQDFISTTQDLLEEGRSIPVNDLAPDSVVIDLINGINTVDLNGVITMLSNGSNQHLIDLINSNLSSEQLAILTTRPEASVFLFIAMHIQEDNNLLNIVNSIVNHGSLTTEDIDLLNNLYTYEVRRLVINFEDTRIPLDPNIFLNSLRQTFSTFSLINYTSDITSIAMRNPMVNITIDNPFLIINSQLSDDINSIMVASTENHDEILAQAKVIISKIARKALIKKLICTGALGCLLIPALKLGIDALQLYNLSDVVSTPDTVRARDVFDNILKKCNDLTK